MILRFLLTLILCPIAIPGAFAKETGGTLPQGPGVSPKTPRPIKVLCLGDSLTEGYGVRREAAWPHLVQVQLDQSGRTWVRLTNAGISGSTSASGPGRLKWALKSAPLPDIVIVELGANDGLRGIDPKATKANLRETIRLAKDRGVLVLLAGMRMPPNYGPGYTEEFSALFSELAKEEGVPLIPFFLDKVAGERSLNQPDGIHPNEAGYKIIAQTVLPHLEPLLKKAASP